MWTAAERRGATLVVVLFVIGTLHDLWQWWRGGSVPAPPVAADVSGSRSAMRAAPGDASGGAPAGTDTAAAVAPRAGPVDLNRADAAELDRLPGIGPVLARRIVEHRAQHGPFRSADELLAVRGIGPRLLERLQSQVTAGSAH